MTRKQFQSTLPTRGSDLYDAGVDVLAAQFQSTLPTRGSDKALILDVAMLTQISIHAPHEGERRAWRALHTERFLFQSTLPTRGSDFHG